MGTPLRSSPKLVAWRERVGGSAAWRLDEKVGGRAQLEAEGESEKEARPLTGGQSS